MSSDFELQLLTNTLQAKYQHILGKHPEASIEKIVEDITQYYEFIIGCMPGNVYWFDENVTAIGCNKNVLNMFGFNSLTEFKGLTFEKMGEIGGWSPAATQSFKQDTLAVIKSGIPKLNVEEPPIPHTDGRILYFLSSRVPLVDSTGHIIGIVGISVDITDRKKAERLQKEIDISNERNLALKAMGASIAHELRTPIASIALGLNGLEKFLPQLMQGYKVAVENKLIDATIKKPQVEFIGQLLGNLKSQTDSCNIIMDISINNIFHNDGNLSSKKAPVSIQTALKDAFNQYPFTDAEKKLCNIEWSPDNNFIFIGDELLTKHILWNLLKNAIYFVQAARKGQITIWLESNTPYNILHFKDTGIGIAKEQLKHMFERFRTTRVNGTGLGLSFCKNVMQSIDGDITVNSVEGEYTHFQLLFPTILTRHNKPDKKQLHRV